MNTGTVMQGSIILAIILLIVAFVCKLQGISAGVFLFMVAFVLALLVIGLGILPFIRTAQGKPLKQPPREERSYQDTLEDLKIRYENGEITTDQFRQMKKDLGKKI